MTHLINKDALVAEIDRLKAEALQKKSQCKRRGLEKIIHQIGAYNKILSFLDTIEVKEVDLDKMLSFRRNIGFAYPEGASEYQKHLACYRQGIEDVLKAQKGE